MQIDTATLIDCSGFLVTLDILQEQNLYHSASWDQRLHYYDQKSFLFTSQVITSKTNNVANFDNSPSVLWHWRLALWRALKNLWGDKKPMKNKHEAVTGTCCVYWCHNSSSCCVDNDDHFVEWQPSITHFQYWWLALCDWHLECHNDSVTTCLCWVGC